MIQNNYKNNLKISYQNIDKKLNTENQLEKSSSSDNLYSGIKLFNAPINEELE